MPSSSRTDYFFDLRNKLFDPGVLIADWVEHNIFDVLFYFSDGNDYQTAKLCLAYIEEILRRRGQEGTSLQELIEKSNFPLRLQHDVTSLAKAINDVSGDFDSDAAELLAKSAVSCFLHIVYAPNR